MELANKDERIRVYKNNENIGPVRNWIECVKAARSKYCKILFSDDLIAPTFVERCLPHMIDPKCGFTYSSVIIGERPWVGNAAYRAFEDEVCITMNAFIRTAIFTDGIFPVSPGAAIFRKSDLSSAILSSLSGVEHHDFVKHGSGVDLLIYIIIALRYPYVRYIPDPLAFFRSHEESLTIQNRDNEILLG